MISVRLDVGSGRTGALLGADGDTRTIAFGFYKACTTLTVNSFSPNQITGTFTGCTMPGMNVGAQGAPFNSQETVMYVDPGYYGFGTCVTRPFECISTTALCGNVATHSYNFTFRTNIMPDSIRVFGVEGAGNPIGGCYPQTDLLLTWSEQPSAPMPFNCLPPQQVPTGPGCLGVMPDFRPQAPLPLNCNGTNYSILTQVPAPGSVVGGLGSNLTVSFYSPNGNVMALTCTFQATVVDRSPPTVICPANVAIPMNSGCSATLTNLLALGSTTDHCDPNPSMIQIPAPGAVFTGTSTVRFVSTDASGNSASCSFLVTAADQQPPNLTCPPPQTASLGPQCQYLLTNVAGLATATDNCTTNPSITQSPAQGTAYTLPGAQTVTLTSTDAAGNTSTCAMTLQVNQLPPQIVCPGGSAIPLSSNCDAFLPDFTGSATFQNLCQPVPLTLSQVPPPGQQLIGVGPTAVMLVSTDTSGAQSTCNFTVMVVDNAPPSLTCPGSQTLALDANCQANLPGYATMAIASDNCTASLGIVQSPAAGSPITGPTTVTLTATDASGNTSTCALAVQVTDPIPPSLTCPGPQTLAVGTNCTVSLPSYSSVVTATDNCTSAPALVQSPSGGTILGIGSTTVTMTASDLSGNTTTCSFAVAILDNAPPSLTCPGAQTLPLDTNCLANLPAYNTMAIASDNCTASSGIVQSPAAGSMLLGGG
ncbi:MAG: HYR domain-containing protein, partial [Bacteroidia bacterium]